MKEQTAIESLKKIRRNGFKTGTIMEPRIAFIPGYVWDLIQSAVSEAEEEAFKAGEDCAQDFASPRYDSFEDWQSKEGTKL